MSPGLIVIEPVRDVGAARPGAPCPEIALASMAYRCARSRRDQLRALGMLAMLRSVYAQGFRAGRAAT